MYFSGICNFQINRVTRTTITSIDHILTNAILTNTVHSGFLQTDISDHFPIFTFIEDEITKNESGTTTIFKREINEKTKETFKNMFKNYDWNPVINENNPNNSYDKFIEIYFNPIKHGLFRTLVNLGGQFCLWAMAAL